MFAPPYRAAVIGRTGRGDYGHGLDLAFRDDPRLQVVAVSDPDPAGRERAAKRLGVEKSYEDHRAMLEAEKPQFVAVAPRWLDGHADMVLACAENGVRGVFCEKPMAPDLASCDAIVDACDRTHMKLAMAFQTRYAPRYARIKAMIAEGVIGEVLELRGRGKEDRRGGGEDLMVLGVHVLDLCRDLLGEPAWCFARVTAEGRPVGPADVRDGAEGIGPLAGDRIDAMFGFQGTAAVAHFATARPKEPGKRFGLEIRGSKGCIGMGFGWSPPAFLLADAAWEAAGPGAWSAITATDEPGAGGDPLAAGNRAILDDLIRAVETDSQPAVDARSGRAAVEMILACYDSHGRRGLSPMPLAERASHPLTRLPRA
ncbi:Gfo/Idh/MocA family protein [Paludisphaera soli]|uniref:Gfo/Idh/MocA family protein n=1 Tax=Paludisphaera soli TaxID=2712865 RepID=UPI0013EBE371